MSFFGAFWGTCRGTEVFERLSKGSWLKAFFHFVLLIFFCSIIVGCGEYFFSKRTWSQVESLFCEQFGTELHNAAGEWQPAIAPQHSRSLQLPRKTLLLYASTEGAPHCSDELLSEQNNVILWAPGCFGTANQTSPGKWLFMRYLPEGQANVVPQLLTFAEMRNQLTDSISLPAGKWPELDQIVDCHSIFRFLRLCCASLIGCNYALNSFLMIFLDTLCFALIFRIFSNRRQEFFSFGELWKIGIYASFPVFAAVTAMPALQLPFTEYSSSIFMIGWMAYLLVILYSLRKLRQQGGHNEK